MKMRKVGIAITLFSVILFSFSVPEGMAASPSAPSGLMSITHTVGITSDQNTVTVIWDKSTDSDGDLAGYATLWDNSPSTDPEDKNLSALATSASSGKLADGMWYFHIRAKDDGGNFSERVDVGPFVISTRPSILFVSPDSGIIGSDIQITITGSAFDEDALVLIGDTAMTDIGFVTSEEITATIPGDLGVGTYDISVINPDSRSDILLGGFEIEDIVALVDAGRDKTVTVGTPSDFSDASASANLRYRWSVESAPEGAVSGKDYILASETSVNGVSFIPATPGSYTLRLLAMDDNGVTKGTDTVTITANAEGNTTPVADAGEDQTLAFGEDVALSGFVMDDDPGDAWTYAWTIDTKPDGSEAELTDGDTRDPSFTPDAAGTYIVSFTATDKAGTSSAPDTLNIRVLLGAEDVNADNVVDLSDAIIVLRVFSGMDVSEGQLIGVTQDDKITLTLAASILETVSAQP